jgi:predicted DNA-binding transcriptional regulator AlpA
MQVSPRTLWRLLSAGKLPEPIRVGRSVRWRMSDIREWIDSGCPPTRGDQE